MSVEYKSGIAKGFLLTDEEVERFSDEIRDELSEYNFLFPLNTICGGDYLFAYFRTEGPYAGCAREIDLNVESKIDKNDYNEVCNTFKRYFPERANEKPKIFIYTQIL